MENEYYVKYKENLSKDDKIVYEMFLNEVNDKGFDFSYIQEIKNVTNETLIKIAPVIMSYDMHFSDLLVNNELVLLLGRKGMNTFLDYLLDEFKKPNIYYKEKVFNFSRRWALSNAIIGIKEKKYFSRYIDIIDDENTCEDSILLIIQLSKWKIEEFIPILIKFLSNPSYEIRVAAVDGLCRYKHAELMEYILQLSNDEDEHVRRAVIQAKKIATRMST